MKAVEEMRAHRQRFREQLEELMQGGIDAGPAMEALDEDLRAIEAAINRHPRALQLASHRRLLGR